MREPNLKALRMFNAAAEHLNFRLAAEALHLTQGAVAQQVRQLEADLGVKLFHRLARGLALTERGKQYYQAIRHALSIIEEATQAVTATDNQVTVSMTPSMAAKWLVPRLADFESAYPDIDMHIIASDKLADFQSDGVDIAIRYGCPPFDKSLHAELLVSIHLLAVCSVDYARKHYNYRSAQDDPDTFEIDDPRQFVIQRLIQDSHGHWDTWFKAMKLQPARRMLAFNQTSLAIDAAITGQGITLVPSFLVRDHLDQGHLISLWQHEVENGHGYYLVYPKQATPPSPTVESVRRWLREALIASA